jgi:hypothetical protein
VSIPFAAKIAMAALIAVSVSAAAAAKPPKDLKPGLTGMVLGASVVLYAVAAVFLTSGKPVVGAGFLVIASEGMCFAAWLGRAIVGGDDDEGGGGERRKPNGPLPGGDGGRESLDWSAFESLRRSWSRERTSKSSTSDD